MSSAPRCTVATTDLALFTDLYQLTMLQAYWHERLEANAVFSLFVRRLPARRNYLLACGIEDILGCLESVRFTPSGLEYLSTLGIFRREFLDWLASYRFSGDVFAVREGTPIFAEEPILEVSAPIAQAQLLETLIMNQIQLQTMLASKAVRVVTAAGGRAIVDFGLRRMHGLDAGLKSARAFAIAGVDATSNVLAGSIYGLRLSGTMAHSFVQSFEHELEAFRAFTRLYPETVLLIDTYDTMQGAEHVIQLARELGPDFKVRAVRLDSGDILDLTRRVRARFDDAGLQNVQIFVSGGLDEDSIAELIAGGAAIDGFGVGTRMGVSDDAPTLDIVYKLTRYAGQGRIKLSTGKRVLPEQKQIYRMEKDGAVTHDVLACYDEQLPGRPLLFPVMSGGRRLLADSSLAELRDYAQTEIGRLPAGLRRLEPAEKPFRVEVSEGLLAALRAAEARVRDE
jgi:nicotinate phosphoribosyltransferase